MVESTNLPPLHSLKAYSGINFAKITYGSNAGDSLLSNNKEKNQKDMLKLCLGISYSQLREVVEKYDLKERNLCGIDLKS
jgi:hypothetical protein